MWYTTERTALRYKRYRTRVPQVYDAAFKANHEPLNRPNSQLTYLYWFHWIVVPAVYAERGSISVGPPRGFCAASRATVAKLLHCLCGFPRFLHACLATWALRRSRPPRMCSVGGKLYRDFFLSRVLLDAISSLQSCLPSIIFAREMGRTVSCGRQMCTRYLVSVLRSR